MMEDDKRRRKLIDAVLDDDGWSYVIVESFILDADIEVLEQMEKYLFDKTGLQE